ncbi:MAG TPA: hypothetical protein ENJ31_10885 [Anaerolineae bacterium]|nr:hypothetical protein [Anaerolineae bacterium]
MATTLTVQMTRQGLLLPRADLGDWYSTDLEAIWGQECIVIRPRLAVDTRSQVRQVLQAAGLLYEPRWEPPPSRSAQDRARLAARLAHGRPLSEIVIADREDRV